MPFPKRKEVVDFEDEDDIYGCPYDYSQELEQIEKLARKKSKKVE